MLTTSLNALLREGIDYRLDGSTVTLCDQLAEFAPDSHVVVTYFYGDAANVEISATFSSYDAMIAYFKTVTEASAVFKELETKPVAEPKSIITKLLDSVFSRRKPVLEEPPPAPRKSDAELLNDLERHLNDAENVLVQMVNRERGRRGLSLIAPSGAYVLQEDSVRAALKSIARLATEAPVLK